ncbi:MAG: ABC transporter ATP-binding protein [Alphaproteobacteria bacterium]|jgi:Cu-processing system ATP-binding protein|nr:ABC transporter ATP-binding protein [Alphaproteobacteria bacterium]
MAREPLLEVAKSSKRYGRHRAVCEASFTVGEGECVALVGHNGAGKTTLMKMILGLVRPSDGRLRVLGEDVARSLSAAAARRLGYLPETISFPAQMTGIEILRYLARLKGVAVDRCPELLQVVGLEGAAKQRIRAYSKGMRQRLGLAQALLGEPELLILDEPTTGLDPDLRRQFYEILDARRAAGTAILLSSHALTELQRHVDRIVVLDHGRVVAAGSLAELRAAAALPVRIKVRAASAQNGLLRDRPVDVEAHLINGHTVELVCAPERKIEVIRWITAGGHAVDDLEVELPDLERLYRHYRGNGEVRS